MHECFPPLEMNEVISAHFRALALAMHISTRPGRSMKSGRGGNRSSLFYINAECVQEVEAENYGTKNTLALLPVGFFFLLNKTRGEDSYLLALSNIRVFIKVK